MIDLIFVNIVSLTSSKPAELLADERSNQAVLDYDGRREGRPTGGRRRRRNGQCGRIGEPRSGSHC